MNDTTPFLFQNTNSSFNTFSLKTFALVPNGTVSSFAVELIRDDSNEYNNDFIAEMENFQLKYSSYLGLRSVLKVSKL